MYRRPRIDANLLECWNFDWQTVNLALWHQVVLGSTASALRWPLVFAFSNSEWCLNPTLFRHGHRLAVLSHAKGAHFAGIIKPDAVYLDVFR